MSNATLIEPSAGRSEALQASFAEYRQRWSDAAREYEKQAPEGSLVESAVPAYAHKNRAIAWLFWRRIYLCASYLSRQKQLGRVMDFGCGVGVSLPLILDHTAHDEVHGVDLRIAAARDLAEPMGFAGAQLHGSFDACLEAVDGPFDTIVALDVLEHFEDLRSQLDTLKKVMAPGGLLLVCGPTENWIYKMGRLFAGFRSLYKAQEEVESEDDELNPYHYFTIYQIERLMRDSGFAVESVGTLFSAIPLFKIIAGRRHWPP